MIYEKIFSSLVIRRMKTKIIDAKDGHKLRSLMIPKQEDMEQYAQSTERRKLSTLNPTPNENIF